MAHTKGEWKAILAGKYSEVQTSDGKRLAACMPYLHDNINSSEVEANAELFAAAPDLLAACEQVLAELQNTDSMLDSMAQATDKPYNPWFTDEIQLLKKVIAKAKGE